MDNQQERFFFARGWLAAMIEGEGSICLVHGAKRKEGYYKLYPMIQITNTKLNLIEFTAGLAKRLGLPLHISSGKYGEGQLRYDIRVTGLGRVKRWLQELSMFLISKQEQAKLILEFIDVRERLIKEHPWRKPYGEREEEIYYAIRELNKRRGEISSTTIRFTPSTERRRRDSLV